MEGPGVEVEDGGVSIAAALLGRVCIGSGFVLGNGDGLGAAGAGGSHGSCATFSCDNFFCHSYMQSECRIFSMS